MGALVLLAVPASGALLRPALSPLVTPHGIFLRPLLPVPESAAWLLVALGTTLFLLLRAQALKAAEPIPLAPARLAQSGGWQLLATGSRVAED